MWIERNEEYPMKVEVNSQALADAVAWTTRVIDARPATPILAGIRLEAIDGTLQLSAFNYAISARHHIEAGTCMPSEVRMKSLSRLRSATFS